ncbi:MAG: alpha/beta hydrolase [Pseudomonadota bacterium]
MKASQFQQDLRDGRALHVYRWLPVSAPKGIVLIIHGMAEHGSRYTRFAKALTTAGYAVYVPDLPGHGKTAVTENERGHFADRDGWTYVLRAVHEVQRTAQREQPRVPVAVFGHSMGSFILQHYVVRYGDRLDATIFSGTHGDLGPKRRVALALMKTEALLLGARHKSALGEQIGFKDYARKFKDRRSDFDWLSRDSNEVSAYIADPHCGHRCTAQLWCDLLDACGAITDLERLRRIPKKLPMLIIAGEHDPVGGGRGAKMLAENYKRAGLKEVEVKVYAEARHELLNETNREEVTDDVVGWLSVRMQG